MVTIIRIAAFGTAIFSILGGFAYNLSSLMIFRAFNGAFGTGVIPVTMALVGQSFNDKERQGAIGKVMGLMFLGGALGTVVNGKIMAQNNINSIFFFASFIILIVGVIAAIFIARFEMRMSQGYYNSPKK